MKQNYPSLIITAVITAIVAAGVTYLAMSDSISGWKTYQGDNFSFQYPSDHAVTVTADPENAENTMVFIVKADENGEAMEGFVPSLQINVSPNFISFALWEDIPWEGFPKIVETFRASGR